MKYVFFLGGEATPSLSGDYFIAMVISEPSEIQTSKLKVDNKKKEKNRTNQTTGCVHSMLTLLQDSKMKTKEIKSLFCTKTYKK